MSVDDHCHDDFHHLREKVETGERRMTDHEIRCVAAQERTEARLRHVEQRGTIVLWLVVGLYFVEVLGLRELGKFIMSRLGIEI